MALTTKRIIALPSQNDPQEGDYLAIDNATGGTHKIPVGRIGVEVDDTLTEQGKAADAKAVGDALDEIRSQIEVTGTASGAIATFTDGSAMPAKSVIVNIEPQQSGSGTPSPENIRPISGWESVSVTDAGKNLFNNNADDYSRPSDYFICPIKLKVDTRYTVSIRLKSGGTAQSGFTVGIAKHGSRYQEFGGFVTIATASTQLPATIQFTTNSDYDDPKIVLYTTPLSSQGVADWLANYEVQLEEGTTATDYVPYNGTTTTTSLGRTVYGGTLDVVTGVLTAYPFYPSYNGETLDGRWICDRAVYAEGTTPPTGSQVALISGTGTTYQLTPTEVKTLLGENNVWADSGDVEVVYVRDLNIVINNLLNNNGTRSLGMMAMSAPTEATAEEPTDEQSDEDMR